MSDQNNAQNNRGTLKEEYQILLTGRRLPSNRSASQTVSERDKKAQLEQLQQTIAKKREKARKKGKKPGKPMNPAPQQQQTGSSTGQLVQRGRYSSASTPYPTQAQSKMNQPSQSLSKPMQPPAFPSSSSLQDNHSQPSLQQTDTQLMQYTSTQNPNTQQLQEPKLTQKASFSSPQKLKQFRPSSNTDKDIFEQLAEYQVLEKVLPCFDHASGIFVQLNKTQQFGQVLKVQDDTIECSVAASSSENAEIKEIKETTETVELNQVKFLCGAYFCQLGEIDFGKVNDRLLQDLQLKPSQFDSEDNIVLIQTVSQQIGSDAVAGSIHRLHVIVPNDQGEFSLHPAVFQNQGKLAKKLQKQRVHSASFQEEEDPPIQYFYNTQDKITQVLKFAMEIQAAFQKYRHKIEKVILTQENHKELLYTVCYIQPKALDKPQQQVGILTRVYKGMAFVRLLRCKPDEQQQLQSLALVGAGVKHEQWFDLGEESPVTIYADLTLGFVAQTTLYQPVMYDIKIRNIKFVSQRESQSQSLVILTHQSLQQVAGQTPDDLCKICKYIKIDSIKTLICSRCNHSYHERCLAKHQLKAFDSSHWLCPDCTRCFNCKAAGQLLVCGECNLQVHQQCIDPQFKALINTAELKDVAEFRCEDCLKCTACHATKPGTALLDLWSKDFKLCAGCDKKRDQKMYCGGCLKFLPENQDLGEQEELMLRCASCNMWMHKTCDRMLEDSTILQKFQDQSIMYACVSCRQRSRANFIEQILDLMISEDKKNDFLDPFWQSPPNLQYLQMIKDPICFQAIKDLVKTFEPNFTSTSKFEELKYLSRPELLRQDIDRIFRNAKTFNPIQSEIHKLAVRMHEKCNQILNQGRIWEIFEINSKVTLDELVNLKWLRNSQASLEGQLGVQPLYTLKPKDLFLIYEQVDIRHFQYLLQQPNTNQATNTNLGKRQRDLTTFQNQAQQQKRLKIGDNQDQQQIPTETQPDHQPCLKISLQDHKKILHEANKRLLLQNLGNLLQNLQKTKDSAITTRDKNLLPNVASFDGEYEQQLSPKSRWRHLIDDLRTSDERDSCWYSSPVRVSFDDPSLIFEEMCYLCGSFGLKEDFLSCNFCGESFHPYCLPCPKESTQGLQEHWFCYNCIFCEKCHSSRQWEFLVLCAVCDKADHFQCLEPQLIQVPECSWKCPDCFKCRTCGTKEFFSQEDIDNKVNLDPHEKYILSFDFEFCYQCGQDQYRKSFCNICKVKTGLGLEPLQVQKKNYYAQVALTSQEQCESQQLFKCTKCKFYSHLECSRTNPQSLQYLASQQEVFQGYQCLDCLLMDKQPGYYLHEQCMLYADLHDRLMAFQTLKMVCTQILSKYTGDDELILGEYVKQNQQWLESDPLIQKWLQLLRTEVEMEDNSTSIEEVQFDARNVEEVIDTLQQEEDVQMRDQAEAAVDLKTKEPRDMYVSLYIKNNKSEQEVGQVPCVEMNENWLKGNSVDFADLFAGIEYRAVIKIRLHFFEWVENGLIRPAIDNADLFDKPNPVIIVPQQVSQSITDQVLDGGQLAIQDQQLSAPEVELCEAPDDTVKNPQLKLTCILCQQSGEKKITGRLIPFQVNQFVHVNCAMWTSEVQEGTEDTVVSSELYNFFFAFKHFRHNKCSVCDLKGATLICANHTVNRKCLQPYYHFPCAYASGKVSFQNSIEIFCAQCTKREKDVHAGLPIKFKDYHRRRVLIVKNLQPQCTTAFNSGQQPEPEQDLKTSGQSPAQQQQYIVNCNKWRPFYYDMFNRAGNLTILSLSQAANSIIESLHNISHQQTTWHQRFKKRAMQEKHSDFASLRIFWKNGATDQKGYYLFNENNVKLIEKPGIDQIIEYVQKLMRARLQQSIPQSLDVPAVQIDEFWQKQIWFLRQRYQNFSQDSTYLTPQLLCGLDKYPIQFWNNPMEKVGLPLRDMNVVNFFYKSADRVIKIQQLYTQKSQIEPQIPSSSEQPHQVQGGLHSIFQTMLKANKYVNNDGLTYEEAQNLKNPKFVSQNPTELQIKQMLGSLDKSQPVLNQLSSRNMSYEQIMGCLGKKTIRQRKLMRAAQTQIHSDSEDDHMVGGQGGKGQASIPTGDLDVNKQTSEMVVKGNEINLAMKYRAARDRPKAVEVCTSKIHRNGLFACQSFNPKDIVIEYVGEKIRVPVADKREKYYEKLGVGDCYLFSLDDNHIIDATFYGNKARYINHSCDPNLKSEKVVVNKETHIIFMANRYIESGEELTFDYQFEYEAEKLECFCGSVICKGRLN